MTVWYYGLKCKFNICSYCSLNDRRYWHAKNIFSFINMKNYKITEIFNIDQCFALTIFFFILGDRRNSQSNSIGSDASSPPDSPYGSQYLNPPTGTCHYIALSWTIVYKKWSSNYLYSDCWNCLFYKKTKTKQTKNYKSYKCTSYRLGEYYHSQWAKPSISSSDKMCNCIHVHVLLKIDDTD